MTEEENNKLINDSTRSSHTVDSASMVASSSHHQLNPERRHDDDVHRLLFQEAKESPPLNLLYKLPALPDEIKVEILSWLPVRSLIRFKCVCKSFKSLISDPQFIKIHLRKIKSLSENNPDLYRRLVFEHSSRSLAPLVASCSMYSIFNDLQVNPTALDYFSVKDQFQFVGSCDGLICMQVQNSFVVIWNPSTRMFNRMPKFDFDFKHLYLEHTVFGFGYDCESDDYKVVAVFCFRNDMGDYETQVKICNRRTQCWRSIGCFKYGIPIADHGFHGKYINGCIVWKVKSDHTFVSFDLAKEAFMKIMPPNAKEYGNECIKQLGVLDGKLCVMCTCSEDHSDIWVMEEYGARESWYKSVIIPVLIEDEEVGVASCTFIHYISGNGEVLLMLLEDCHLVICNPEDGTYRYPVINVNGINNILLCDFQFYIESLVSP